MRRLSFEYRLECLASPMEAHLDDVRRCCEGARGLVGIEFFDIAQQKDASAGSAHDARAIYEDMN
jgi:hypothetical protein